MPRSRHYKVTHHGHAGRWRGRDDGPPALQRVRPVLAATRSAWSPSSRSSTPDYRRRWKELRAANLLAEVSAWGMTETHTSNTLHDQASRTTISISTRSRSSSACRCQAPNSRSPISKPAPYCRSAREGDIRVRTPSLLKSYWNKPEATAEVAGRWLAALPVTSVLIDKDGFICIFSAAARRC